MKVEDAEIQLATAKLNAEAVREKARKSTDPTYKAGLLRIATGGLREAEIQLEEAREAA